MNHFFVCMIASGIHDVRVACRAFRTSLLTFDWMRKFGAGEHLAKNDELRPKGKLRPYPRENPMDVNRSFDKSRLRNCSRTGKTHRPWVRRFGCIWSSN